MRIKTSVTAWAGCFLFHHGASSINSHTSEIRWKIYKMAAPLEFVISEIQALLWFEPLS